MSKKIIISSSDKNYFFLIKELHLSLKNKGLLDPFLNKELNATVSLFNPEYAPETHGFFMLEPFDPDKIPVIFVHGFWSSATTWIHMLNDLRGDAEINKKFQF